MIPLHASAPVESLVVTKPEIYGVPCPHGRAHWGHCPHCLGLNSPYAYSGTITLTGYTPR